MRPMRPIAPRGDQLEWVKKLALNMLWSLRKGYLDDARSAQDRYYEALSRALDRNIDILPLCRVWWGVTEPETVWGRGMA